MSSNEKEIRNPLLSDIPAAKGGLGPAGRGCFIGAVMAPAPFCIVSIVFNDAGGPCFWPMVCAFGGAVGFAAGLVVAAVRRFGG